MVKSRIVSAMAALAVAAAGLGVTDAFAHNVRYTWCSQPPPYDRNDINYMRAGVSASARLAVAIRAREYLASCHTSHVVPPHYRHRHHPYG
jgi:hypothetical protein